MDLPESFWQSIRHLSSFKNKAEYDKYLQEQIEKYEQGISKQQSGSAGGN